MAGVASWRRNRRNFGHVGAYRKPVSGLLPDAVARNAPSELSNYAKEDRGPAAAASHDTLAVQGLAIDGPPLTLGRMLPGTILPVVSYSLL